MAGDNGKRAGAALLVGVGDYLCAERVQRLRYAARDAEAFGDVLIDPEICGFPAERVKVLTDTHARRDELVHHLSKWLPAQSRDAEIVVIYFAGHGTVHRIGQREEGYLLPHDADPDDLVTRGVAMGDLARWIEAIPAKAVVVCLDCCHAGRVIGSGYEVRGPETRDMRIRPAILMNLMGKNRFLIASCDEGQESIEAETRGHGLFTFHLLEGIRGAGDRDGDGKVGVAELFEHVAAAVESEASAMGMVQRPWSSAIGPGGMFLSRCIGKTGREASVSVVDFSMDALEQCRRDRGSSESIGLVESWLQRASEDQFLAILDRLAKHRAPEGIIPLCRSLAHPSENIRNHAKQAVRAFGWDNIAHAIQVLAIYRDEEKIGPILDGLAAFEAHPAIVTLLDRLVNLLTGDLRNRTILLLERKQQGLQLEQIAAIFQESRSRYRIKRALGQGLFTAAYLARDESTELDLVVRVLRSEFAARPQVRAEFLDLSRRAARLVHHNLVLTREVQALADHQTYFAARDYVDGITLRRLLESGKSFEPDQVQAILRQILLALSPIHAVGLTHCSVKSSNIFLCGANRVVLGDLALPLQVAGVSLERLAYDFRYAPPETFRQGGALGPWSDFYALGCVAYELLCGAPPFVSDNPYDLATKHDREAVEPPTRRGSCLGPAGDVLILSLLAKSPTDRPSSVVEILRALDDAQVRLRSSGEVASSAPQLLGEESLIHYDADALMSLVSFPVVDKPGSKSPGPVVQEKEGETLIAEPSDEGNRLSALRLEGVPSDFEGTATVTGPGGPEDDFSIDAFRAFPPPHLGRYVIDRELGRGGMGTVYLARDESLGRWVAIKTLALRSSREFTDLFNRSGPDEQTRFRQEARAVARLQHLNIVSIFDVGEEDDLFYAVLEYVEGGNLQQKLQQGPMSIGESCQLISTLARAVQYAHEHGIIHRDLKPSNILFTKDAVPKISDFGLAKITESDFLTDGDQNSTRSGQIMGTPAYMAPEQARGQTREVGPAADIFALGAILYETLTAQRAFQGASPADVLAHLIDRPPRPLREIRPEISHDLQAICLKCLEKDWKVRYAIAADLAADLERLLAGDPIVARRATYWDRLLRFVRFGKPLPRQRSP